jgi:hypothetical protein
MNDQRKEGMNEGRPIYFASNILNFTVTFFETKITFFQNKTQSLAIILE